MITNWMLYSITVGLLVSLAAWGAEGLLRSLRRPVRFVWAGAMVLLALVTMSAPFRMRPVSHAPMAVAGVPVIDRQDDARPSLAQSLSGKIQLVRSAVRIAFTVPQAVDTGAAIVWTASSVGALLLLLIVYVRYAEQRYRWPCIRLQGESVRLTPDVGPAVIGVAPPEIVVPEWVLARNPFEQRLVIAHEREHVRAHDPQTLLAASVLLALMPWNVALWFMWSRLRLAVELDCDSRVLQHGVAKPAYGNLLVELSGHRSFLSPVLPAFSFGTSHLEQRLVAMTAHPPRHRWFNRIACGSIAALALVAACSSELPTAPEIAKMDAKAVAGKLMLSGDVQYVVDGKPVSKADANAIDANQIASVEVVRGTRSKPGSVVSIKRMRDSNQVLAIAKAGVEERKVVGQKLIADSLVLTDGRIAIDATGGEKPVEMQLRKDSTVVVSGNGLGSRIRVRGASGSGTTVLLREGSPRAEQPLVIVDGVVQESGMADINPERIASVEVVKRAAASRISADPRAANGIIRITLKK